MMDGSGPYVASNLFNTSEPYKNAPNLSENKTLMKTPLNAGYLLLSLPPITNLTLLVLG